MATKSSGSTGSVGEAADEETRFESEDVEFEVFRYVPEEDDEPRFETYELASEEGMTVLDALIEIRDTIDPSLTVRHSCRMARCGSDAVYINGKQRLACNTQVADLDERPVRVEPLPHFDVVRDLVVEMDGFYDRMESVEPWFQPDGEPETGEEYLQSPENRQNIDTVLDCIWCGACTSSCTPAGTDSKFEGPAAMAKAYRFYKDEREGEEARKRRLEMLEDAHGLYRCHTQFNCTEVCPKDISPTEAIMEMSRDAVKEKLRFWD
ncbi:MAG: succinate dehydrogenase/fumarate reductase iron-sulfur subunit [Halobacteria archaeon]|nr:succinate dehydrogenase/fumarate reductase iron-sulfur subunit [Halobacteria archaeon]